MRYKIIWRVNGVTNVSTFRRLNNKGFLRGARHFPKHLREVYGNKVKVSSVKKIYRRLIK